MTAPAATETVGLVQQFVQRTGQLYSLPAAAAEVLRLTSEPRIDPRALKQCIETDPALAARILRVVNSSLFGPSRQVTDLGQALTLLGIRPLKMLVLGFSLPKELFAGLEAEVLARYWRLALVKAVAARELAERLWRLPGDEAFLAGLVQDIGILALIQQLGPPYQKLLSHVQTYGGSLLDRELETLGFDHLVLSARLLSHWGLPAGLCAAISLPPDEDRIGELTRDERTLPRVLHLAHLLVRLIEQPYGSALSELLAVGARYCGLTYPQLQPIVETVQLKVQELAQILSLKLPDAQSYVDLLLTAQQRLADESITAAAALADGAEEQLLALAGNLRAELALAAHGRQPPLDAGCQRQPARPCPAAPDAAADPSLSGRVAAAIQRSRQTRTPLTLAICEIDHFADVLMQLGPVGATQATSALESELVNWTSQRCTSLLISDSQVAVLWENCPRSDALQLARSILAKIRPWSQEQFAVPAELTLSIGLATLEFASKNYPAQDLIDAARRCLSAVQLSGGNTVKSIAF
jgi:HD-like signal output (HDOD) protein/GGDEF domain-containing protein